MAPVVCSPAGLIRHQAVERVAGEGLAGGDSQTRSRAGHRGDEAAFRNALRPLTVNDRPEHGPTRLISTCHRCKGEHPCAR